MGKVTTVTESPGGAMQADTPEFQELRQALQADGADLVLEGAREGVAAIRLVVGPETCLDCIMPKATLEQILLASLQRGDSAITRVELEDPRPQPAV